MMPTLRWIIVAVIIWLAFVVVRIPATWGAWLITNSGDVGLSGVSGTLWQGRAGMASIRIDGQDYSLGELTWQLLPTSLLRLKPCARISTDLERQQIAGIACVSAGGQLSLRQLSAHAPANLVRDLAPNIRLEGQLSAHIQHLQLADQRLKALEGNLSWTGARLHDGHEWFDLGSFATELSPTPEGHILAQVFSLDGPIDLAGSVTMPLNGGIFINVHFALTEAFAEEIYAEQWLPIISEPLDNGRYKLEMQL